MAKTLIEIMENPIVAAAIDRSRNIDIATVEALKTCASRLYERNPSRAFYDGNYQGTDLDAFTMISALSERNAVINLPSYSNLRETTVRTDQRVLSKDNRHGKLLGVKSNAKTHAFSVLVWDYNVLLEQQDGTESVGAYRNFSLVSDSGEWHDGFRSIEVRPTEVEKNYIQNKEIESRPNMIAFKYFVHPSLANSMFGASYVASKILEGRVTDEKKFYTDLSRELISQGIEIEGLDESVDYGYKQMSDTFKSKIEVLEAKIEMPEISGEYRIFGKDEKGNVKDYKTLRSKENILRYALDRKKELGTIQGKLRTKARAVEYAFFKHGFKGDKVYGNEIKPGWDVPDWTRNYKETPKSRTIWNALPIADDVNLLYRIKEVTVHQKV